MNSECYNCGQLGHWARDCQQRSLSGRKSARDICYRCGESGHYSRDCKQQEDAVTCFAYLARMTESTNLLNTIFLKSPCLTSSMGHGTSCYNCGRCGHVSRDCQEQRREQTCYRCGNPGHLARNCPDMSPCCFSCGAIGHLQRDCCTKPKGY